jgi:predicted Zn-dependent peptidase
LTLGIAGRTEQEPMHALHTETLANGLRVVVVPQPHLHTASVSLYVKAGSRYESAADNGLSHFLEHMLFRGTERLPSAYALNHAIESLGGTLAGATHADFTLYQVSIPPESLAESIALFGDIVTRPVFSELDVEKGIVREEILEALDEDGRHVDIEDISRELVFEGHALGYKLTGDAANVDRFDVPDLRRWLARFYGATNSVVVISGAVDADESARLVREAFSALPAGALAECVPPELGDREPGFVFVESVGSQTDLRVSFLGIGERDPRRLALELVARVLDDGMSTRLHRRICDERGLAYDVFAALDLYEDCGIFDLGAAVEHGKTLALVEQLFALTRELRESLVSGEELLKAQKRYLWELRATLDDAPGVANFYGVRALLGVPGTLGDLAAAVQAVTAEDVRELARELFRRERLSVTAVGLLDDEALDACEKLVAAYG